MAHNLKTLGVALVAVLALIAAAASTASAAEFTASTYPTSATGASIFGNETFGTEAGSVECNGHFQSTLNAKSVEMTLTATYTSCKAFGFLSATVSTGCDYRLILPSGSADTYSTGLSIACGFGPITIVASTCEMTIGEQLVAGGFSITNETTAGDMTLKANLSSIKYTVTKDGLGCPFSGTGAKGGGTYRQDSAITFDTTNGYTIDMG